ncbi:MAG: OmpA family protein [Lautropia sp.]|nr:OmpA family protein [Lautropia sp.]
MSASHQKDQAGSAQATDRAASFEKIEEAQVARDQGIYRETQARIAALNAKQGIRLNNYALAKAQCWLDVSFHEYSRNDRGGFPRAALQQAQGILDVLEQGSMPDVSETPLVNGAKRLRQDLWARHAELRQSEHLSCAASRLACAEVELVHAGNEIRQGGWRHASPYIQMAEDLTAEAEQAISQCGMAKVQTEAPAVAPVSAVSAARLDVHFHFDQHQVDDILPDDLVQLRQFAEALKANYSRIDSLNLIGYADRMGNERYNSWLSMQRAMTVRDELQRLGISQVMGLVPMGAVPEKPSACQVLNPGQRTENLACLQPDRRVSIEVVGVKKVEVAER